MAVIRLLILSIIIPHVMTTMMMMMTAGVMATGDDKYHPKCYDGNGAGDVGTAVQLKESLTRDLIDKVPPKKGGQNYCNMQTWNGLKMYGFAYCKMDGRDDVVSACHGCLSIAGGILIDACGQTGSGEVMGEHDLCYVWVGFDGCPSQY